MNGETRFFLILFGIGNIICSMHMFSEYGWNQMTYGIFFIGASILASAGGAYLVFRKK